MSIHELDLSHIVFPTCEQTFFFSSYFLIIFYIFSLKTRVLILKQAKISCKSSEKKPKSRNLQLRNGYVQRLHGSEHCM